MLEVLARGTGELDQSPFAELYEASQPSRVRNSTFDMKDHLKARGYRWSDGSDGRPRSWWIEIEEEALDYEFRYLRTVIYRWAKPTTEQTRLTAFARFKA